MGTNEEIRIGIVGAGNNTRLRHIPGFQQLDGVEVISVANRSRESGERTAEEFGISKVYDNWVDLVDADDTNAICIGTWPYLHCPITLRALERGKHVLTEARMAMNASEARSMLSASREHPDLITQVVPSPFTFRVDSTVEKLVSDGYLGDILAIDLLATQGGFIDNDAPLSWRTDIDLSGNNIMTMGIWYEALMRWVGPATRVKALTQTSTKQRLDSSGTLRTVVIPDHVDIICAMACGGIAHLRISSVMGLAKTSGITIYGTEGTINWDAPTQKLFGGRRGDSKLEEILIKPEHEGSWQVEQEFVRAIRGEQFVELTRFEDGLRYMEFTDAVNISARSGESIDLPLVAS